MDSEKSKIIDRIKKLFSLSENEGATEGEATSAMKMASTLMLKYGIQAKECSEEIDTIDKTSIKVSSTKPSLRNLASAAAQLNAVKFVYNTYYKTFTFYGEEVNREATILLYEFLTKEVYKEYKKAVPKGLSASVRSRFRNSFENAAAVRIAHRAYEIVESWKNDENAQNDLGVTSLVVTTHIEKQLAKVDEFIKKMGTTFASPQRRRLKYDIGSNAGDIAGQNIRIQHAIM